MFYRVFQRGTSAFKTACVIAVPACLAIGAARADEHPRVKGELSVEIQNDHTYRSDDPDSEINDLYATIEQDLSLFVTRAIFFNTHLTVESVRDPSPGEDRAFGDHGAYIDALTANYETGRFGVFAGKFGPNFSIAYDAAPGLYGGDIAGDDIEISERIGLGGKVSFGGGDAGTHALSASLFFADTTILSESAFTDRGRTERSDGGPSNTESLESVAVAVDGNEFFELKGFRYHVGFVRQAVDSVLDGDGNPVADIDDEYRLAAAVEWAIKAGGELTVTPLAEYVHFWNAGGVANEERDYLTASVLLEYKGWDASLAYTGRFIDTADGSDQSDFQVQLSAGYTFDFGLGLHAGWKTREEGGVESQTVGASASYAIEF